MFFVFKQKTAYEMLISDWSSDVCSSDLAATSAGTCTSCLRSRRAAWMLGKVIRFMCGHRLQGLMNSTCGNLLRRLSAIEHSVIIATRCGCSFSSHFPIALVEPTKSASASTSGGHAGCETIFASTRSRVDRNSVGEGRSGAVRVDLGGRR